MSGSGNEPFPSSSLYAFPVTESEPQPEPENEPSTPRKCSVRGCSLHVAPESTNKMCLSCRGKHRVYAMTKRARRKQEKAAVEGETKLNVEQIPGAAIWMPGTEKKSEKSDKQVTEPFSPPTWDPDALDPQLFRPQCSELAGALGSVPPSFLQTNDTIANASSGSEGDIVADFEQQSVSEDIQAQFTLDEISMDPASSRFCSVKGCRHILDVSYSFKMCEPCRDRYRLYGTKKRAKWRAERKAFDKELDDLRLAENERRQTLGLPPITDNPEELKAWELSIINEKMVVPPGEPYFAMSTSPGEEQPNFETDPGTNIPIPARMCTVSHCHKVLPAHYTYKRCEQHRLQNRYHSKLKRVREKVIKAAGPGDASTSDAASKKDADGEGEDEPEVDEPHEETTEVQNGSVVVLNDSTAPRKKRGHACTAEGCHNLINPTLRWRMCDDCRLQRKQLRQDKQAQVESELRAAEKVWEEQKSRSHTSTPLSDPGPSLQDEQVIPELPDVSQDISNDETVQKPTTPESDGSNLQPPAPESSPKVNANKAELPPLPAIYTPTVPVPAPFVGPVKGRRKTATALPVRHDSPQTSQSGSSHHAANIQPSGPYPFPFLPPPPSQYSPFYMPPPYGLPPYGMIPPAPDGALSYVSPYIYPGFGYPGPHSPYPYLPPPGYAYPHYPVQPMEISVEARASQTKKAPISKAPIPKAPPPLRPLVKAPAGPSPSPTPVPQIPLFTQFRPYKGPTNAAAPQFLTPEALQNIPPHPPPLIKRKRNNPAPQTSDVVFNHYQPEASKRKRQKVINLSPEQIVQLRIEHQEKTGPEVPMTTVFKTYTPTLPVVTSSPGSYLQTSIPTASSSLSFLTPAVPSPGASSSSTNIYLNVGQSQEQVIPAEVDESLEQVIPASQVNSPVRQLSCVSIIFLIFLAASVR
ncbi:hypothetical protein C8J56DRAFT_928129 [Mycena floridula]|nr:hypothetical protein C8J56DRAFT_928129 [Mycena floridula]